MIFFSVFIYSFFSSADNSFSLRISFWGEHESQWSEEINSKSRHSFAGVFCLCGFHRDTQASRSCFDKLYHKTYIRPK